MTEVASELIQTLKRYIYESDERIKDLEEKVKLLTAIDISILEASKEKNKNE